MQIDGVMAKRNDLAGKCCKAFYIDMKVEIFTVCDSAKAYGNKLDIIGSSELFSLPQPMSFLCGCLVYRLRFEHGDAGIHLLRIAFTDEDGKLIGEFSKNDIRVEARPNGGFVPNIGIIPLKKVLMPRYGEFSISLFWDNERSTSIPIYCIPVSPPK